jgi:hypothetical protein
MFWRCVITVAVAAIALFILLWWTSAWAKPAMVDRPQH